MKNSKREISGFSKFIVIVEAVLAVVLTVISVLDRCGLRLIAAELPMFGCILMVVLLLLWGAVLLFRKITSRTVRMVVSLLVCVIGVTVGMTLITQFLQLMQLTLPYEFATVESPEGKKVVVLMTVDTGAQGEEEFAAMLERMNVRREAILAAATPAPEVEAEAVEPETAEAETKAAPEATEEVTEEAAVAPDGQEYPSGAFGWVYTAYPKAAGLFYRPNADVTGEIYRGTESAAELRFEWTGENSVRLYLENAEPGDSGEIVVNFD